MHLSSAPIGVFDSGVGGLTVVAALVRRRPDENFVYLGDTSRIPYGSKPAATVRGFAFELAGELVARGVKAVVVACNTASTASLPDHAEAAPVPVWGVVEPGVAAALAVHRGGRIDHVVTGDVANYRHVAAMLDGPAGRVAHLQPPLPIRHPWPDRTAVTA